MFSALQSLWSKRWLRPPSFLRRCLGVRGAAAVVLSITALTLASPAYTPSQRAGAASEEPAALPPFYELDAVKLAVADLGRLPADIQPFQRYLYVRNGDDWRWISLAVNIACLRGAEPALPVVLADGRLLRWDLRFLASERFEPGSLKAIIRAWEELRFDPSFREVIFASGESKTESWVTKSEANFYEDHDTRKRTKIPGGATVTFVGDDDDKDWEGWAIVTWAGKTGNVNRDKIENRVTRTKTKTTDIQHSFHAGGTEGNGGPAGLLQRATVLPGVLDAGSQAVIVDHRYFLARSLATVDIGFGRGIYYDLRGIDKSPDAGVSDLDFLLKRLGANVQRSIDNGTGQAGALNNSEVTGKYRKIIVVRSDAVSPARGNALVWITEDPNQAQTAAQNDPLRTFLNPEFAASEVIFEGRSGLLGFSLNDANGVRQDSAPDNVVADRRFRSPHPTRLHGAISCIGCHFEVGGYKSFPNDFRDVLAKTSADVFADAAEIDRDKAVELIVQLSQWEPETDVLGFSRANHETAVGKATNGLRCAEAGSSIFQAFNTYAFAPVTPADACRELQIAADDPIASLTALLTDSEKHPGFFKRIDPHLVGIASGKVLNRHQWDSIYAEAALRRLLVATGGAIMKDIGKQ